MKKNMLSILIAAAGTMRSLYLANPAIAGGVAAKSRRPARHSSSICPPE